VSYAERIRRLASRVSESRQPKRLGALTRLARDSMLQPAAEEPSGLPAVTPVEAPRQAAPSLPVSEQATRWLTHGEAPEDLIPLLGDPMPPAGRPAGDPQQDSSPQTAGGRQVLARIVEGRQVPSVTAAAKQSRLGAESVAGRSEALARQPEAPDRTETLAGAPETAIQEIPGVHGQAPPMLRLARRPQQPSARDLALLSGGDLSEDEPDTSTVLFRSPAAPAGPPAGPGTGPPAGPPTGPATGSTGTGERAPAKQAASPCDGPSGSRSESEIDEIYEELLRRLRRDLIHDRERLGDLLGPLR
jgi:hypothetical protein